MTTRTRLTLATLALIAAAGGSILTAPPTSASSPPSRVCVDQAELAAMPRTTKADIERALGQRGVRDRSYEAFAADFGFDVGRMRMFTYQRCGGRGKLEVVYDAIPGRAWPIVYSATTGPRA